jgi:hypothetical protein
MKWAVRRHLQISKKLWEKKMKNSESLIKILTPNEIEEEFIPQLESSTKELFKVLSKFRYLKNYPSREMVFSIMKEVDRIETFLDDVGASLNKRFSYFRKLIASIRWMNIVIFQGIHILIRFDSYMLELKENDKKKFIQELSETVNRCLTDLKILIKELQADAIKIGVKKPSVKPSNKTFSAEIQQKLLPQDIDVFVAKETGEASIDILVKFLESLEFFNTFFCQNNADVHYTEESFEHYRSIFNRLESLYDTYLRNAEIEKDHPLLRGVRSSIAVTLHLLEMGKALAHFYERHGESLLEMKPSLKKSNFANKKDIDSVMKDFLIHYSIFFLNNGRDFASTVFKKMGKDADEYIYTTKMLNVQSHRLEDFHLRPIMPVTQIANKYKLNTYLYQNRNKYNLKSAIEMAIAIPDIRDDLEKSNIDMIVQGPRKAVEEIAKFFYDRCGAIEKPIVCDKTFSPQSF